MKDLAIAALLAIGLTAASPAGAQTLYTCGDGTVRSVQSLAGNAIVPTADADSEGSEKPSNASAPEKKPSAYLVTVQLYDMVYTGQSSADAAWNVDPTLFETNERIFLCANDREMVIDRLDGTDFRAPIVCARPEPRPKAVVGTR